MLTDDILFKTLSTEFDLIDPFIAGLAETLVGDSSLGETFTEAVLDQFLSMRRADRFWYEGLTDEVTDLGKNDWANNAEIEALVTHYEDRLVEAGYFFPPEKAPGMKTVFRNLWSRMRLTRADVQMLHGIMRQMVRWKEQSEK